MSQETPVKLITTRPDQEVAEDLRTRMIEAAKPLLRLLEEASENKFLVNLPLERDQFGHLRFRFILLWEF